MFMLKTLGKLKRKDNIQIVAIVAKCKFDTEPYDSSVEKGLFSMLSEI